MRPTLVIKWRFLAQNRQRIQKIKFGKMKVKVNVPETFEDVVREEYKATPAAPCSRDYYLLISVILEPTARPVS